jgi:formyltetrahydrofolate synthetase
MRDRADLASSVERACKACKADGNPFKFLYPLEMSLKDKIETICREMYGAVGVEYTEQAETRLQVSISPRSTPPIHIVFERNPTHAA